MDYYANITAAVLSGDCGYGLHIVLMLVLICSNLLAR